MGVLSDLATVLSLALLTSDRSKGEQAALERVAARLDQDRNALTITNHRWDWNAPRVPCTWSATHPNNKKEALAVGMDGPCKCAYAADPSQRLLVPPFTDAARREPLCDVLGWSIAADAVRMTPPSLSAVSEEAP